MRLRNILILFAVLLIIGGAVAAWMLIQSEKKPQSTTDSYPVEVKNLESSDLSLTDAQKTMVKSYVSSTVTAKHGEGEYEATYREGSYKRTVNAQGGIINTALVDVNTPKETYLVTWTGGDNDPYGTSYVRCAPEADQIVHPSTCKELAND
jgi:hypothetical protein